MTAASFIGATALLAGLLSAPMASAAPASLDSAVPTVSAVKSDIKKFKPGGYIVTLKQAPAATYGGGISGLAKTKVAAGKQLDAKSSAVKKYSSYLTKAQNALAAKVGVDVVYNYSIALNGFSAKLTAAQAAQLAKSDTVLAVTPVEVRHPTATPSVDYLGLTGAGGVWEDQLGGIENAGAGVVIGDLDTGIAPENPSFAGDTLGTTPGAEPYLDGDTIVFEKSDNTTFASERSADTQQWNDGFYSTKIIGAQAFHEGIDNFGYGIGTPTAGPEYNSPRDGDGHGSHTASTAAGVAVEDVLVEGKNFGDIIGVAPEAKIAAYKVCWNGPYTFTDVDDGCYDDDLIAAVEAAVSDGVDVINFSIGGGAATTVFQPLDQAFFSAAAAGVFISASAGNSGPSESTSDHAAPWYTTVAASTIPDYEGTVELGNGDSYLGATITVDSDVTAPIVSGVAVKATAATTADATLCAPNSLDPALAVGKIIVCDRGGDYARTDRSDEVDRVGGVGLVLLNAVGGANDVVNDFHAVPTVHLPSEDNEAVRAYAATAGATATLVGENTTDGETPVPQLAGFSSHGPDLAAGEDILKPDISAPGVSILADGTNSATQDPTFQFLSGTSMAAPHITGLAALYLSKNPNASPAEIKSAMMTTAVPVLNADGDAAKDVFGEGAGNVHPTTFLDPGLVYLSTEADWKKYLLGTGEATTATPGFEGVTAIDPSDLNVPSIAIGTLLGSQTVTRTVTVQTGGTYTSSLDGLAGLGVTVTPSSFTAEAGDTKTFTVSFDKGTAPMDVYSTGYLNWSSSTVTAKIPVAIHPTTVVVPATASGTGTTGSTDLTLTGGVNGSIPITVAGLVKPEKQSANGVFNEDEGIFDDLYFVHEVPSGTTQYDVEIAPAGVADPTLPDGDYDLDLQVQHSTSASGPWVTVASAETVRSGEKVTLLDPEAGFYRTVAIVFAAPVAGVQVNETTYTYNPATYLGASVVVPSPTPLTIAGTTGITVDWTDLAPNTEYRGAVVYASTGYSTVLTVNTGAATTLTNTAVPVVTGAASVGSTLVVSKGTWSLPDRRLAYAYQWNADGVAIAGATSPSYLIPSALIGKSITATVTAKVGALSTAATSAAAVVGGTNGGTALTATVAPKITGDETVGDTLTATTGIWNVPTADLTFTYQWLSNGAPIAGATSSKYKLPSSSYKKKISALVTATLSPTVAISVPTNAVTVDAKAKTTIKLVDSTITTKQKAKVKITVSASNGASETGKVVVHYGSKTKTVTLKKSDKGKVTVTLPKLKKGSYKVYAEYKGTSSIDSDSSIKKTLKVRKA